MRYYVFLYSSTKAFCQFSEKIDILSVATKKTDFTTMHLFPSSVFLGGGAVQRNTGGCYCPRRAMLLFLNTTMSANHLSIKPTIHPITKVLEARQVTDTSKMDKSGSCPKAIYRWAQGEESGRSKGQ